MAEHEACKERKTSRQRILRIATATAMLIAASADYQIKDRALAQQTTIMLPERKEKVREYTDGIRGITWNIRKGTDSYGKPSLPKIIDTLSRQEFDFACIPEARKSDAEKITRALGTHTGIFSPTYADYRPINRRIQGNLLLISSALVDPTDIKVETRQLYQANRGLLPRRVVVANAGYIGLREAVFATTHLEAKNSAANTRQAAQANYYVAVNAPKEAAVMGCLDINADGANANHPTIRAMAGDQLKVVSPGVTFDKYSSKIDVFISDLDTRIANTYIVKTNASDHHLAGATFHISPEPV